MTHANGSPVREILVNLPGRVHGIIIGRDAGAVLSAALPSLGPSSAVAVVADAHVSRLHAESLRKTLPSKWLWIEFPEGEASKSLAEAERVYDKLAEARFGRDGLVIGFGGGVAGDLAGFIAGTWMRGVRLVQVPTTLEAAIDASIGGKTAVNHRLGKNLVGVFHQPAAVCIATEFLDTLSDRDLRAGLAESVKHALIRDPDFLMWHETHLAAILAREPETLVELIARNCAIKAAVVVQDEREAGLRMILNFGHTIGHALELTFGYALRHGECVGLGMLGALHIGQGRGWTTAALTERVSGLLEKIGLPRTMPATVDRNAIWHLCLGDKKARAGKCRFVLLRDIAQVEWTDDVTVDEVGRALDALRPRA